MPKYEIVITFETDQPLTHDEMNEVGLACWVQLESLEDHDIANVTVTKSAFDITKK